MSKVGSWSTTAGNNNSTPPDGWPEGQAPSTVNDCAREMMAQIRTLINDIAFVDLGMTPTRTGATTFTVTGNQTGFFDYGRRVKAFDATTLYGTVISSSFTTNTGVTLRIDNGGVLTTSMTSVAVSALSGTNNALPEPACINTDAVNTNGYFDIWQNFVNTNITTIGISGSAAGTYVCDMWAVGLNGSASVNGARLDRADSASHVPSINQCGQLLNSSLVLSVSAADAALAGSDYAVLQTVLEGRDAKQLAGKPAALSFWAHTNRTGTYCVSIRNGNDRSFIAEYQLSAASTWEKKTILIPEIPTTGTWDYSTGIGLQVTFTLAAGATFQAAAGAWTSMNALATSNQTNWLASAGHAFRIAGVKLNEGNTAFPLEYRPYDKELSKCQRYLQYFLAGRVVMGFAFATTNAIFTIPLDPEMRLPPTVTFPPVNAMNVSTGTGAAVSVSAAATINAITQRHVELNIAAVGAPLTIGQGSAFGISITAGACISFSSQL